VAGERELLQVVLALHATGRLADLLDRGEEQPDQDGNDGDDDQQFDEGEPSAGGTHAAPGEG
jgi:hypothetical protein